MRISESNIDEYTYNENDDVDGDIDMEKTYTEDDFYRGRIYIRERDEHRVEELLAQINPDEKTIIFCGTQLHANIIRDMVNQRKRRPAPNYCMRVTANDGEVGEQTLREFQDNERLIPTILTTSQKLSTGVDARNVRNIVLMRPVNNMVEFKQIIGRGTRLFDDKYYFTIYDFVGANKNFQDAEWDGDPFCPVCGNYPCSCKNGGGEYTDGEDEILGGDGKGSGEGRGGYRPRPQPCPVCGHLPCTCDGGQPRTTVKVRLSAKRELELKTTWTEKFQYGEDLISLEEFIKILFGRLPYFFTDSLDLHKQWEHPDTRLALLDQLEREGFAEDKLRMVQRVIGREDCDLLDVLEFLAYATTPIDRVCRVELVRQDYYKRQSDKSQEFLDFLMEQYVRNGEREFTMTNLPKFLEMKYGSTSDAIKQLSMNPTQIKNQYLNFQKNLYIA